MGKSKKKIIDETYSLIEYIRTEINSGKCNICPTCIKVKELHDLLVRLLVVIKDDYPLESERLQKRVNRLVGNIKINPFDFGGIQELVYLLKAHEDGEEVKIMAPSDSVPKRKIFISHSSSDKSIVNAFIKAIVR